MYNGPRKFPTNKGISRSRCRTDFDRFDRFWHVTMAMHAQLGFLLCVGRFAVAQKKSEYSGAYLHAFLTYIPNYERHVPISHKENVYLLKFCQAEGEGMGSG
jgi:hypothetical protein